MKSVYDFKSIAKSYTDLPGLKQFLARDGEPLSYRFYDNINSGTVYIFLHGSSSHGQYLHPLATYFSSSGAGQVYVPNLRGHYASGFKRGDCAYIGQLEDDIIDLINKMRLHNKQIFLVGHSSGGGLAIRFAGGKHAIPIRGYILFSPIIPKAGIMRQHTAGGWARLSIARLLFLSVLNRFGIKWFNHLNVIEFNLPIKYCDGKETLAYSFNLNVSYHPRLSYEQDFAELGKKFIILVGSEDEANDPNKYSQIIYVADENLQIIDQAKHLNIVCDPIAMQVALDWAKNRC